MQPDIMPNKDEFIKDKSFEIAWAVFRCAKVIQQPKLKLELESLSVEVVNNLGNVDNLNKLEQLIRLAEAVEEINKTNAFVLFREIDNLLNEIIRQRNSAIQQLEEENSAIDRIFTKAPISLFNENINNSAKIVRQGLPRVVRQEENSAMPTGRQAKKFDNPSIDNDNSAIPQSAEATKADLLLLISEDRQNLVLKKLKELGKATTKELLVFFSEVSERTIRFYLQKLCEQGLVSRIGSTGPGSYYVAK